MVHLKKIWVTIKNYWYIPLLAIGAFFLFFVDRKNQLLIDSLRYRLQKNKEELDELNRIEKEKKETIKLAEAQAAKELDRIEKEYEQSKETLDEKKKKQVEELLKKDPRKLAKELSKLTGFKVVE